jgi:hypothetical protein
MIKDKRLRLYSIFEGNVVGMVVLVLTLKAYFKYHSDVGIHTNSSKTYWDVLELYKAQGRVVTYPPVRTGRIEIVV